MCIFRGNNGLLGGGMAIFSSSGLQENILIENCILIDNYAGNGGFIGFSEYLPQLSCIFRSNFFRNNWATCNF